MASVTIDSTNITVAITKTDRQMTVRSATGFSAGNLVFINGECMRVAGDYVSGTTIPLIRGVQGTKVKAHNAGARVYCGEAKEFYNYDPSGKAATADEYALPHINLSNGRVWDIASDEWYEVPQMAEIGVQTLTPTASDTHGVNVVLPSTTTVIVGANVTNTDDFITLPSLADVPDGHRITVIGNTAGFEVRTPAGSAEEINSEDCDGTKEYLVGSANPIHYFTKINNTIGWMGQGFTAIGAVVTAVVPD